MALAIYSKLKRPILASSLLFMFLSSSLFAVSDYELLGIDSNVTEEGLKKAFRRMSLRYHPDRIANLSEEKRPAAEEEFKNRYAAYERIKEAFDAKNGSAKSADAWSRGPKNYESEFHENPQILDLLSRFCESRLSASLSIIQQMTDLFSNWENLRSQIPKDYRTELFLDLMNLKLNNFKVQGEQISRFRKAFTSALKIEINANIDPTRPRSGVTGFAYEAANVLEVYSVGDLELADFAAPLLNGSATEQDLFSLSEKIDFVESQMPTFRSFTTYYGTNFVYNFLKKTFIHGVEYHLYYGFIPGSINVAQARAFLRLSHIPDKEDANPHWMDDTALQYHKLFLMALEEIANNPKLYAGILSDEKASAIFHSSYHYFFGGFASCVQTMRRFKINLENSLKKLPGIKAKEIAGHAKQIR